jgi:hypothetical protein
LAGGVVDCPGYIVVQLAPGVWRRRRVANA